MNMTDVKEAVDTLASTFEEFKAANNQALQEMADKGAVDAVTEAKVARLDEEIERLRDAFARGDQKALRDGITDEIIDEFCLVGPPGRCRERLDAFRSEGVEMPILMIDPAEPGEDYPTAMRRTLKGLAPKG